MAAPQARDQRKWASVLRKAIRLAQIAYTYLLFARSTSYLVHDLTGEPVPIPDQVRDRLSPDRALLI
jgi:hypothetical protein